MHSCPVLLPAWARPRTRVGGVLITTTKRADVSAPFCAAFSTENIKKPVTSKTAHGLRRRLPVGFISRESSSVRTRCQHSRTVYGIRIPQGGSSAVRVLAAITCRLFCRGVPVRGCPLLALKRRKGGGGGAHDCSRSCYLV